MANRYTIEMNFAQAKRQAERLEAVASNLTSLSDREFAESMRYLSGGWTGENANKYQGKAEALKTNIRKSANDLNKTASTIRQIAKNIYDAEMEALRIAEEREAAARKAAEEAAKAAAAAAASSIKK